MNKVNIIIFDEDEITKTLVEGYLKELTFPFELQKYNELDENLFSSDDKFNFLIVNIGRTDSNLLQKISDLSKKQKNKFIVISNDSSTDLHVRVLRAGAKDFLLKPLKKADFLFSLQTIYKVEILNLQQKKPKSVIHVVTSLEKGMGKTTFSINFSKELADASNEKVLLVDFNNTMNDVSFLLNVDIQYNTAYYMNKLTKENAVSLLTKLTRYKKSNLYVMANGFLRNEESDIDVKCIYNSLQILKEFYRYIVVDINKTQEKIFDEVLSNADVVWMMTEPSLPLFEKIKSGFDNHTVRKNSRIVLNKYEKKYETSIETFQSVIGKQIYCKIPKNYIAVGSSQSNAQTIREVAPALDIANAYVKLAKHIASKG